MVANRWRKVSGPVLGVVALAAVPMLVDCGGLPKVPGVPNVPGMPGNCPDMADASAVANFDWQKEFKLDAEVSGKLKGGLQAAIELKGLAAQIDGELKTACNKLSGDLGGKEGADGPTACKAAIDAMGAVKAKMGASAKISLAIQPPVCSASMDAAADCAGSCDASATGGKAEVKCEGGEISGECGAKCEGSCNVEAGAKCEGTCNGACDAGFSGTCNGTCDGKCDGKDSKGACKGKCDGKCDVSGGGTCTGSCKGDCKLKAGAECKGSCSGKCSVEMKAPKCSGTVEPPKVSAECKAHCDAKLNASATCTPARVSLNITGSADAAAQAKFKSAVEANLPAILKVAIGMKDKLEGVAASVKGVVDGLQGTV